MEIKINKIKTKFITHDSFNFNNQHALAAASEIHACAYFLGEGYEVFKNVSSHGPIDMIIYKKGEINMIEVKSASFSINNAGDVKVSESSLRDNQQGLGIKILYVSPTGSCSFNPIDLVSEMQILVDDYLEDTDNQVNLL